MLGLDFFFKFKIYRKIKKTQQFAIYFLPLPMMAIP